MYKISARCTGLDPNIQRYLETAATFPIANGEVIRVRCKLGNDQLSGDVMMTCIEGTDFSKQAQISCAGRYLHFDRLNTSYN